MSVISEQQSIDEKEDLRYKFYFKIKKIFESKIIRALGYIAILFVLTAVFLSVSILSSVEVINTLVDVIAALVGLFGILAIYLLSSLNHRRDSLRIKADYHERRIASYKKRATTPEMKYLLGIKEKLKLEEKLELEENHYKDCKARKEKILVRRQKVEKLIKQAASTLLIAFGSSFILLNLIHLDEGAKRSFALNLPPYMSPFIALLTLLSLSIGIMYIISLIRITATNY